MAFPSEKDMEIPILKEIEKAGGQVRRADKGFYQRVASCFQLTSEDDEETILVPTVAVVEENEENFVYVLKMLNGDTATVHRRIVSIGDMTGAGLEITEGLEDGEMVVTAGISKLSEGLTVRLLN